MNAWTIAGWRLGLGIGRNGGWFECASRLRIASPIPVEDLI